MMQPSPSLHPFMLVTSTQMHRQGDIASKSDFDTQKATMHVMKLSHANASVHGHGFGSYAVRSKHGALCYHLSSLSNKVVSVRIHQVAQHKPSSRSKVELPAPTLLALATLSVI